MGKSRSTFRREIPLPTCLQSAQRSNLLPELQQPELQHPAQLLLCRFLKNFRLKPTKRTSNLVRPSTRSTVQRATGTQDSGMGWSPSEPRVLHKTPGRRQVPCTWIGSRNNLSVKSSTRSARDKAKWPRTPPRSPHKSDGRLSCTSERCNVHGMPTSKTYRSINAVV